MNFNCTVSIGVSMFKVDGETQLNKSLREADTAVHHAKAIGGNKISFFDESMREKLQHEEEVKADLVTAIQKNQFVMYYQPQFDKNQVLVGAESLIRLLHPTKGVLPPGYFLEIAEQALFIDYISYWVIEKGISFVAQLIKQGLIHADFNLSINVSANQFKDQYFADSVNAILIKYDVPGDFITLEVTESMLMDDIETVFKQLELLKQLGVKVSIDDFGTGFSSLMYLQKLPIDELKIDKTFVDEIDSHSSNNSVIKAIIKLSHELHLKIVAEGIENEEQLTYLQNQGCNYYQGYLFAKPMPEEQFVRSLEDKAAANDKH